MKTRQRANTRKREVLEMAEKTEKITEPMSESQVNSIKRDDLEALADAHGVTVTDDMKTKQDIADAINATLAAPAPATDDRGVAFSNDTSSFQPKEGTTPVYLDQRTGKHVTPNNKPVHEKHVKDGAVKASVAAKAEGIDIGEEA